MPFYFAIDIRHRTMNERVPLLLTFSYLFFLHVFLFHPNFFGECALRATTASTSLPQTEEEKKGILFVGRVRQNGASVGKFLKGARYTSSHSHNIDSIETAIFVANPSATQTKIQCFYLSKTWVRNKKNWKRFFCPLYTLSILELPICPKGPETHFSTLPDFFKEGEMSTAPAENGQQKYQLGDSQAPNFRHRPGPFSSEIPENVPFEYGMFRVYNFRRPGRNSTYISHELTRRPSFNGFMKCRPKDFLHFFPVAKTRGWRNDKPETSFIHQLQPKETLWNRTVLL